jgi:hypothetical protein
MEVRGKFHITFTLTPKGRAPNSNTIEGYVCPSQSGHYRENKTAVPVSGKELKFNGCPFENRV